MYSTIRMQIIHNVQGLCHIVSFVQRFVGAQYKLNNIYWPTYTNWKNIVHAPFRTNILGPGN